MFRPMLRLALASLLILASASALAEPRVVVSVKPLHSLAAAVMGRHGQPRLLIDGAASPHTYALRPREAQALSEADLVLRIGPTLEAFLNKPLESLARRARVLDAATLAGLHHPPGAEPAGEAAGADDHAHRGQDPHIWLDPRNAIVIARAVARELAALDPAHAADYRGNAERLAQRIAALDAALQARLAPLRGRPFVVFHDAYRYLQNRYGLHSLGAITVSPERQPGARRIVEIRRRIVESGAVCVFSEPQFQPRLVTALTRGSQARTAELDPLGAAIPAGPQAYVELMRGLGEAVADCLSGKQG